jgi:hypothetical protein
MKIPSLYVLALALAGCTPDKPRTTALTAAQATDLALRLANEKSQVLYQCRPYTNGPAAQFVEGYWVWHDRRGQGQVDFEATVRFANDGAEPSVSVLLLDSRGRVPERRF